MKFIPQVVFSDIPVNQEVDYLHGFIFNNSWGWGRYIFRKHPKLRGVLKLKGERQRVSFLREYVLNYRSDNRVQIEMKAARFKSQWKKIEKKYFFLLSEIMETEWPPRRKKMKAQISINSICPRFLGTWSFTLFFNYRKTAHAMETIMHESCHFLWFKKWKEVFPDADKKTYEMPHIEWHLSEIMAPIILNDGRIQKLLRQKAAFYDEHQIVKIGGKTAPNHYAAMYARAKKEGVPFSDFMRSVYADIQKNKSAFIAIASGS